MSILELIGIHGSQNDLLAIARRIEKGLPSSSIDRVKDALNLNDKQMSAILDASQRTLTRLRAGRKHVPVSVGDRLFRIANIFVLAADALESEDEAKHWLRSRQVGLNNRTPLELLNTEAGAREIERLLGRIEYGVYS